jgi:hypothetical protein
VNPPVIQEHEGIIVVRDDLVPGGTKQRVLPQFLDAGDEFVYASPAYGYAQVALAKTCQQLGKRATIFTAKRNKMHVRTAEAARSGAKVVMVPHGYLSNVQAKAKAYAETVGAVLLPFGLDFPDFLNALSSIAKSMPVQPEQVWCVAGSGTLCRALQQAWPDAEFMTVRVGAVPSVGSAKLYHAPEPFEKDAKEPPPFPSCSNYDAKAWRFIKAHAKPGALFWNVAG